MFGVSELIRFWGGCFVAVGSLVFKECACQTFTEDQMFFSHGLYSTRVEKESSPKTCNKAGYPVLTSFIFRICVADEISQWLWFPGCSVTKIGA